MAYYDRYQWQPYVPVHQRRANAEKELAKLRKAGHTPRPVQITGRAIASSAWGSAWCEHLESYSDYENRLPRGRTYARNGSVVDLQIAAGKVTSLVQGSSLYRIEVTVTALPEKRWSALVADTSGRIDSVLGLLRGRIDAGVMARMCDRQRGLFPSPAEIRMRCSCPDSAGMCKHLAATLYGVGARLDSEPELLFLLRGVDHRQLIAAGAEALSSAAVAAADESADEAALGALFGIELGDGEESPPAAPVKVTERAATPAKAKAKAAKPAKVKAAKPATVKVAKPAKAKAAKPANVKIVKPANVKAAKSVKARAAKPVKRAANPSVAEIIAAAVSAGTRRPRR